MSESLRVISISLCSRSASEYNVIVADVIVCNQLQIQKKNGSDLVSL